MRTRAIRYADVNRVCEYLKDNHARTGWDFLPINPKVLRESVVSLVRTERVADVLVAEDAKGELRGVLLATMDRFFWNKSPYASDIHFISTGGGPALLTEFKHWAKERGCVCIVMAVATDDPRAEDFLAVSGFSRRGGAMVCMLDSAEEKAA